MSTREAREPSHFMKKKKKNTHHHGPSVSVTGQHYTTLRGKGERKPFGLGSGTEVLVTTAKARAMEGKKMGKLDVTKVQSCRSLKDTL